MNRRIATAIRSGKDFVQIKSGPFDLDIIHAPDGIENFDGAKSRSVEHAGYPVASLRDIIASKRASNRAKDRLDLEMLEEFRKEFEKRYSPEMKSAAGIAANRSTLQRHQRKRR